MMLGFKIKPWMVTGIASIVAFVAKALGGALAGFSLFGLHLLKPLSVPFKLLGKLAIPLLVLTAVLVLFKFVLGALRKMAKKRAMGQVARRASSASDEEGHEGTTRESERTQTKDLHGFDD